MKTISFIANKGGVGKTRLSITTANLLAALGYKVTLLDLDFNNSSSAYYASDFQQIRQRNIARAIAAMDQPLSDFEVPTWRANVRLVASSRQLADFRGMTDMFRLQKLIMTSDADYVIIDCQPAYDNLTINAINASNLIITPALKDLDSLDAAKFLEDKISHETAAIDKWRLLINGYNNRWENAAGGKQKEYLDLYETEFGKERLTPPETWLPWTSVMNDIKDRGCMLASSPTEKTSGNGCVYNASLYKALTNLVSYIMDSNPDNGYPEYF